MTNDNTSVDDSNIATFLLARQHLSNRSFPNDLVDVVATYDRLDRVGAHWGSSSLRM